MSKCELFLLIVERADRLHYLVRDPRATIFESACQMTFANFIIALSICVLAAAVHDATTFLVSCGRKRL